LLATAAICPYTAPGQPIAVAVRKEDAAPHTRRPGRGP
jgi:hypothetical protein